jgi:hypothetical protein
MSSFQSAREPRFVKDPELDTLLVRVADMSAADVSLAELHHPLRSELAARKDRGRHLAAALKRAIADGEITSSMWAEVTGTDADVAPSELATGLRLLWSAVAPQDPFPLDKPPTRSGAGGHEVIAGQPLAMSTPRTADVGAWVSAWVAGGRDGREATGGQKHIA